MIRPQVQLLTRAGCTICDRVDAQLEQLAAELDFDLSTTDVDAAAAAGDSGLRAEFGDRLPVVLSTAASTATGRSTSPGCAKTLRAAGDYGVNLVAHRVNVYRGI